VTILVISPDGQVVGRIIEATAKPLKALLVRYEKEGAPMMIGDSNEEVCWDGFEFIKPGDPRWPDALARGLRSAGYRFREEPWPSGSEGR